MHENCAYAKGKFNIAAFTPKNAELASIKSFISPL